MKNENDSLPQNPSQEPKPRMMYSEAMAIVEAAFASKNLLTKKPLTTIPETNQDNVIEVTFIKRSKNHPKN
jgi:hypothetical protein